MWLWVSGFAFTVGLVAVAVVLWFGPDRVLERGDKLGSVLGGLLAVVSLVVSLVTVRLAVRPTAPAGPAAAGQRLHHTKRAGRKSSTPEWIFPPGGSTTLSWRY
jgi:hypothetical protein